MKTLICPTCGCSLVRLGISKDKAAVYHHNDGSLFAFSGGDQHLGWRNPDHVIRDDHVFVRLAVAGYEVPDSTNTWVELQVVDDQLQIEELCEDQMKVAEEKFLELGG